MKRFPASLLLTFIMLGAAAAASGAETDSTARKFKIVPTARALFDMAAYTPQGDNFRAGVTVPDVRLGAKATFGEFEARADISYRFGKLYPADIYLQWNINDRSFLKGGYFIQQFGLQSATGASHKISMEEPIAQTAFGENRLLGAMYVYDHSAVHFAGSLFAQPQAVSEHANDLGRTGVGATARFVWHPLTQTGNIFQIGTSVLARTPEFKGDTKNPTVCFSSPFPTKVSSVTCVSAEVDHLRSVVKLAPELIWGKGRWGAEAQFYYMNASRRDGNPSFRATGLYVLGRVLLNRNAAYSYDGKCAYFATPKPKSWEITAGYSFVDLDDASAAIYGGRANSAMLTMNYYLNKYITWRVNYSYTARQSTPNLPALHVNIFQTRIQFVF